MAKNMKRRRFIQIAGAGTMGAALPTRMLQAAEESGQAAALPKPGPPAPVSLAAVPRGADEGEMAKAVRRAAQSATDFAWLKPGDAVFIKPASNSGVPYPAVTHPIALKAMIELLKDKGAGKVIVHIFLRQIVNAVEFLFIDKASGFTKLQGYHKR